MFTSIVAAQAELDERAAEYNHRRPHQGLDMAIPAERFIKDIPAPVTALRRPVVSLRPDTDRPDGQWVTRRASAVGVVCVQWQQVCLGVAAAGRPIDVWVTNNVLQFYDGDTLLRTEQRTGEGEIRVKRVQVPGGQRNLKPSVKDQPK